MPIGAQPLVLELEGRSDEHRRQRRRAGDQGEAGAMRAHHVDERAHRHAVGSLREVAVRLFEAPTRSVHDGHERQWQEEQHPPRARCHIGQRQRANANAATDARRHRHESGCPGACAGGHLFGQHHGGDGDAGVGRTAGQHLRGGETDEVRRDSAERAEHTRRRGGVDGEPSAAAAVGEDGERQRDDDVGARRRQRHALRRLVGVELARGVRDRLREEDLGVAEDRRERADARQRGDGARIQHVGREPERRFLVGTDLRQVSGEQRPEESFPHAEVLAAGELDALVHLETPVVTRLRVNGAPIVRRQSLVRSEGVGPLPRLLHGDRTGLENGVEFGLREHG
jgi:hypothetical protein